MIRFVDNGTAFEFINDTGAVIEAGTVVESGGLRGITQRDFADGERVVAVIPPQPTWEVELDTAAVDEYAIGAAVYYDPGTQKAHPSAGVFLGWAVAPENAAGSLTDTGGAANPGDPFIRFVQASSGAGGGGADGNNFTTAVTVDAAGVLSTARQGLATLNTNLKAVFDAIYAPISGGGADGFVDGATLVGNQLNLSRTGTLPDVSVDLAALKTTVVKTDDLANGVATLAVDAVVLGQNLVIGQKATVTTVGSQVTIVGNDGTTAVIDTSGGGGDGNNFTTAVTIDAAGVLSTARQGLATISTDLKAVFDAIYAPISGSADGFVDGATLVGNQLNLSRTGVLADVSVDLTPLKTTVAKTDDLVNGVATLAVDAVVQGQNLVIGQKATVTTVGSQVTIVGNDGSTAVIDTSGGGGGDGVLSAVTVAPDGNVTFTIAGGSPIVADFSPFFVAETDASDTAISGDGTTAAPITINTEPDLANPLYRTAGGLAADMNFLLIGTVTTVPTSVPARTSGTRKTVEYHWDIQTGTSGQTVDVSAIGSAANTVVGDTFVLRAIGDGTMIYTDALASYQFTLGEVLTLRVVDNGAGGTTTRVI